MNEEKKEGLHVSLETTPNDSGVKFQSVSQFDEDGDLVCHGTIPIFPPEIQEFMDKHFDISEEMMENMSEEELEKHSEEFINKFMKEFPDFNMSDFMP